MGFAFPSFPISTDTISISSSISTLSPVCSERFPSVQNASRFYPESAAIDFTIRFRHVCQVQSGTTAIIYKSVDLCNPGMYVACKVLRKSVSSARRFRKEERIHRLISQHPNIVDLYGTYESNGELTFVQEFCSKGELLDSIPLDQGLPEVQVIHYFSQIVAAVQFMHSLGIAHRDIKPENIVLSDDYTIKLVDFGEAVDTRRITNVGLAGTVPYIAPEVLDLHARGGSLVHTDFKAADSWSMGVVLFGLLTGRFPWNTATMDNSEYKLHSQGVHSIREAQRWASFSPEMHTLVTGLLMVNINTRWSAREAAVYIDEFWPSEKAVIFGDT
eukprot:CFRG3600T1